MADNRPGATARIIRWIDYRLPFVQFLNHELNEYPTICFVDYITDRTRLRENFCGLLVSSFFCC